MPDVRTQHRTCLVVVCDLLPATSSVVDGVCRSRILEERVLRVWVVEAGPSFRGEKWKLDDLEVEAAMVKRIDKSARHKLTPPTLLHCVC